jgi:hypothetical protein
VAAMWSVRVSIVSGGALAVIGSALLSWRLPEFVRYRSDQPSGGAPRSSVT